MIQGWREEDLPSSASFSPGSPLDLLLERPEDASDVEDVTGTSPSFAEDSVLDQHGSISSRSVSSESIMSMPDLVLEDRSPPSWGSPSTPSIRSRKVSSSLGSSPSRDRKDRVVSSPSKEECMSNHPLLPPPPQNEDALHGSPDFKIAFAPTQRSKSLPQVSPKSSFKSNLTASLNALASSFRSFSNFTAPSIPPDDLLTRSIFPSSPAIQQRYVSEMRPKSSEGVPDAALRRYLNPTPGPERERQNQQRRLSLDDASISALALHRQPDFAAAVNVASSLDLALDFDGPMIQMQTYGPGSRGPGARKAGRKGASRGGRLDANSEAGRIAAKAAPDAATALRQREPRENSDFLRVIVLEMNMRREGKLDARGAGRARVWLPPRKTTALEGMEAKRQPSSPEESDEEASRVRKVPVRWIGVGVDEM
ncbi:MAG: hypothetical protein INR71_04655 [Terriglobus roseus]|nr:hypothetical protein [Terriglobus roseus]